MFLLLEINLKHDENSVTKELPFTITVKNLKLIINHVLKIRTSDQILHFINTVCFSYSLNELKQLIFLFVSQGDETKTLLDDDQRSLHYFGMMDGATVLVSQS